MCSCSFAASRAPRRCRGRPLCQSARRTCSSMAHADFRRDLIDRVEPGVMACMLVFLPGIPQANNEKHIFRTLFEQRSDRAVAVDVFDGLREQRGKREDLNLAGLALKRHGTASVTTTSSMQLFSMRSLRRAAEQAMRCAGEYLLRTLRLQRGRRGNEGSQQCRSCRRSGCRPCPQRCR